MENRYNFEVFLLDQKYMLHIFFLADPRICHRYP